MSADVVDISTRQNVTPPAQPPTPISTVSLANKLQRVLLLQPNLGRMIEEMLDHVLAKIEGRTYPKREKRS